jgi:hypothetical protein
MEELVNKTNFSGVNWNTFMPNGQKETLENYPLTTRDDSPILISFHRRQIICCQ